MPRSRRFGLAVAIAGATVATTVLPFTARAEPAVLYVDSASGCSDQGTGTKARPFCTVQAAADAAEPGQTVDIEANHYFPGQVTVRRSGLPGKPIVFRGDFGHGSPTTAVGSSGLGAASLPHAFLLDGVHDVTLTGLFVISPQESVLVKDSSRIVLDRLYVNGGDPTRAGATGFPNTTPSLRITGASADVTVSRNRIYAPPVAGIAIESGATGAVVTTNLITRGPGWLGAARGVLVTDAPGTVVVSNTFAHNCGTDLELAGNSAGAVVANNILTKRPAPACGSGPSTATPLVVSAGSTQGTTADHNTVVPLTSPGYSWGGTSYANPEAFRATGQGAHDNATGLTLAVRSAVPDDTALAAEGITDAADPTVPGMLDSDLFGLAPADHPGIADTAPSGVRDRGAIELQDSLLVQLSGGPEILADHPLNARFSVEYVAGWSAGGATLDFGDGSTPVPVTPGGRFVDHDYPAAGTYTATLTGTSAGSPTRTSTSQVTVAPVRELRTDLLRSAGDRYRAQISVTADTYSPWPVVRHVVDFGDGTAPQVFDGPDRPTGITHEYGVGGSYTITTTVTDDHGRTARVSQPTWVRGPATGVPFTSPWGPGISYNGLFDKGTWLFSYRNSDTQNFPTSTRGFGSAGDLPVVGNWDNTCQCQLGIYRPSTSTFALQRRDGSVSAVPFGDPGDLPAVGKWDGDGRSDQLAVYRPGSGLLAVRHDDGSVTSLRFGDPGDLPVVGDWDGVGHAQFGLFRPGRNPGDPNLFILRHDDGSVSTAAYGEKGDLPVVGDWLGSGRTSFGIYRPTTHRFALSNANHPGVADYVYTVFNG
ncbi:PKD domain-containing protein [Kitasatospora sp. NPDC056327]|uniref:PKD domain-containing protein n=1 Tax=Kitasatospora sp. NPDC056327 TaxID=3345785 RepID=UPI0035E33B55